MIIKGNLLIRVIEEFEQIIPGASTSIKSSLAEITDVHSLEEELEFLMDSDKSLSALSKTGSSLLTLYSESYSLSAFCLIC